jgi:hypothetical protein
MIIKPVRPAVAGAIAAATGAVAITLAVLLTASGVAAPAAHAETSACGSTCADLSPLSTGTADVIAASSTTGVGGTTYTVGLAAVSATNSTEDWSMAKLGTVSQFYDAGLIGKVTDTFWPGDQVYEIQYTPSGTPTGNCMASPASLSTAVTLAACGTSATTLWIADTAAETSNAVPLINGTSESFSEPQVLTAGTVGSTLSVKAMLTGGSGSTPSSNQLWLISYGQL